MHFCRKNSHQGQTGPLPYAKVAEELLSGVLDRRLDTIDGGHGHGALSLQAQSNPA
jgi:hypothetical protein